MLIATKGSKINISSKKKLEDVVKKIKNKIKPGNIIFLYGEMGVGKTTFAKYLINIFQLEYNEKLTEFSICSLPDAEGNDKHRLSVWISIFFFI